MKRISASKYIKLGWKNINARLNRMGIEVGQEKDGYFRQERGNRLRANCFNTDKITMCGKAVWGWARHTWWNEHVEDYIAIKERLGKIPNCHCPDCGAQAYRTDQPGVATCGDYLGWYFFYEEEEKKKEEEFELKIVGGKLTKVPKTQVRKENV